MEDNEKNLKKEENEQVNKDENQEENKNQNVQDIEDKVNETSNLNVNNESIKNLYDELKIENDDLNDRYKRILAEFDNYKKRSQKEKESIYGMITGDVVATMLPIMDNLQKASDAKTEDISYQEGIKLVARQFQDALKSLGLEEIETVGERFNPEFHEAVSHVEDETKGEQEIVQEYRKGYRIGNKVIRHSMVIVAN